MDLTDDVIYEVEGSTAYVTFNRPEKHNALAPGMGADAARAIRDADGNDEVRAIVVTGAGEEAFCAGADLEQSIPRATNAEGEGDGLQIGEDDLTFRDEPISTPIISAVNGVCVAGGFEFILATDIRIAEAHARFGLQEPRWGLAPSAGSHTRLPRQIPFARAMEFFLTGDLFPAEHALEAGLVNEVVPKGESLARAEEIAASIAENSPHAVRKIKEAVLRGLDESMADSFRLEAAISREVFGHEDAVEGPRAFVEGRDPSFKR